ncbi:MAG: hypothetical protein COA57_07540, partial [Flavobacteriales bacterium]
SSKLPFKTIVSNRFDERKTTEAAKSSVDCVQTLYRNRRSESKLGASLKNGQVQKCIKHFPRYPSYPKWSVGCTMDPSGEGELSEDLSAVDTINIQYDLNIESSSHMEYWRTIYLVERKRNAMFTYYGQYQFKRLKYNPNEENVLWAVTPDNKLAVFGPEDFAQIDQKRGKYTFKMKVAEKDFETKEEIKEFLDI